MPSRKRQAAPLTPEASGRRRSTRISSSGQKSKYFDGDDSDEGLESDIDTRRGKKRAKTAKASASARGGGRRKVDDSGDSDADAYEEDEEEDEGDEEEEDDGDDANGGGNYRGGGTHRGAIEDDDDEDEDAAPKVTFIPHKKLRDLGSIDYADDTVHPVTMHFLKDLKSNNRRNWLKGEY